MGFFDALLGGKRKLNAPAPGTRDQAPHDQTLVDGALRDGHVIAIDGLFDDAFGVDQHALGGYPLPPERTTEVRRRRLHLAPPHRRAPLVVVRDDDEVRLVEVAHDRVGVEAVLRVVDGAPVAEVGMAGVPVPAAVDA